MEQASVLWRLKKGEEMNRAGKFDAQGPGRENDLFFLPPYAKT